MSAVDSTFAGHEFPPHEVAVWLRRHPDFLTHYPDLAEALQPPKGDGRTASLASYQLDVLRDKNRELTRRLHDLNANAETNERLAVRTHQLTLGLLRQTTRANTVRAMVASLTEDFAGDVVRIGVLQPEADITHEPWCLALPEGSAALAPFKDCLREGAPIAGRLNADKHRVLYGEGDTTVQSSLLLPVPGHGVVAVGSVDANRFYPGMGTLFAQMMADALAAALERFTPAPGH